MNQLKTITRDFQKCLAVTPLPIISLMLYLGLKSTTILPDGGMHEFNGMYHPAYLGWYDFVLGYSIIFSFITGILKLELKDLVFGLTLLFIISASWTGTYEQDKDFIIAGIVCYLRFFLVFVFAKSLVYRLGYRAAESVLVVAYGVLSANAVLWYSLQFGIQNRMAASAMTSPSFGQVSAILCLIFYSKKYYPFLFYSFIFLFLTFSRTSLLLFLIILVIQNRKIIPWNLFKYVAIFAVLAAVGIMLMTQYGGQATEVVLESRFSFDEISNLNGRSSQWIDALEAIETRHMPIFGIGFHMSPSLIEDANIKYFRGYGLGFYIPPHFHNIIVEYALGLGVLSLIIFFYLIKRIVQTFRHHYTTAFFVFTFFLISQTLDYTFNAPKEIIVFSLMLGLAEGQWRSKEQLEK